MARNTSKSKRPADRRERNQRKQERLLKQVLAGKISIYALAALEGGGLRLPYRRVVE